MIGIGIGLITAALGGATMPAWVINQANPPDVMVDFTGNRAWRRANGQSSASSLLTVTRASGAYVVDSAGNWTLVAANLPRISDRGLLVEESRTNSIRNNSMQGAIVGAGTTDFATNGNFALNPINASQNVIQNSWQWSSAGGTSSASYAGNAVTLIYDGTNSARIDQAITTIVGQIYAVSVVSSAYCNLNVGTSKGFADIIQVFVGAGGNTGASPVLQFTATGTTTWLRIGRQAGGAGSSVISNVAVTAPGVELLTNGTFTGTTGTGWTVAQSGAGTVNFSTPGQVVITGDGATNGTYIEQQITGLTSGRGYVLTATVNATLGIFIGSTQGGNDLLNGSVTAQTGAKFGFTAPANGIVYARFYRLVASPVTVTLLSIADGERIQNGGFNLNPINAAQNTVQNGWQWSTSAAGPTVTYGGVNSVTLTGDGTNTARFFPGAAISTTVGVTYTLSLDVATNSNAVLVGTTVLGSNLLNATAAVGIAQKFQFTATSTTSFLSFTRSAVGSATISNVSVISAGALPTNWSVSLGTSGLTRSVVGTGTDNGVDYIDLQFSGTPTATTSVFVQSEPSGGTSAANGQSWAVSAFVKLGAGSLTNISATNLRMTGRNTGVAVSGQSVSTAFTAGANWSRPTGTFTFSDASITGALQDIQIAVTNGLAVDITIRIGWPQLELGGFVTSPIRTTSAAATRAADVVTLTTPGAFGSAYTLYAKGTPQSPDTYVNVQGILLVSDGTTNNRAVLRRNSGANPYTYAVVSAGVAVTSGGVGAWPQNTSGKLAAAFAMGDQQLYGGGSAATPATSALPVGVNAVGIGYNTITANFFNGFIAEIAIWNSQRVPNAQLQSITA